MGLADKNFRIVYHCWRRGRPVAMQWARGNISSGLVHSPLQLVRRRSHRSCLPVAIGRPAEGGVASLRPWQIAIYEQWASIVKKRHVTFALFASSTSPSFSLLSPPSVLSTLRSLLPWLSRELRSSFLLLILRPSFFYRALYLPDKDLPPAPLRQSSGELFADNFAERKSHRVRLLSEPWRDSTVFFAAIVSGQ